MRRQDLRLHFKRRPKRNRQVRFGVKLPQLELLDREILGLFRIGYGLVVLAFRQRSAAHPRIGLDILAGDAILGAIGIELRLGGTEIFLRQRLADIFHNSRLGRNCQSKKNCERNKEDS